MIIRRYMKLKKALDLFYKSEFKDVEIDRYSIDLYKNGVLLFTKRFDDPRPIEQYVFYLVKDNGTIRAMNPKLNRFNFFLIKKIPEKMLSKYKH